MRTAKIAAVFVSGVSIVLLLAAGASAGRSASRSTTASCSNTPVRGGNLVYERQAATATLDPLNPRNGNGDIFAYNLIYSGLVRSDPTGRTNKIVPSLADSWTVSADGKTYTFHLRPGIKFSNGQPVTADDVAWTMNRFGNPKINAIMAAVAGGFAHATVVSSSTVRIQLTKPVAAFLYDISIWPAFILPKGLVEKPFGNFDFAISAFAFETS